MKKYDLWGGLIWLILGMGLCIGSVRLNLGSFRAPSIGFFPFLTGVLMGLFGLILTFSNISKSLGDEKILAKESWRNFLYPSLTLLILFGYALLLEHLGFLITTLVCFFFLFKLSEPKKWVRPFVLSLSTVLLSYLIFCIWLQVQFPKGIFKF